MVTDNIAWPELPESGFLVGRTATTEDVERGLAVFALLNEQGYEGILVDLTIPQYAFHIDKETGARTPVVIVQAETNGDIVAIGYKSISDGTAGVALRHEFEFLGTKQPDR